MSYQKITIVGHLGRDPEMRYTPTGQAVTNFSVATSRQYTSSNGERIKETLWFRVSSWGKQAEICNQYLKKGNMVMVEGRLNPDKATGGPRIWTRQDGTPASSYEITSERVVFLTPKGEGGGAGAESYQGAPEPEGMAAEDEIPF